MPQLMTKRIGVPRNRLRCLFPEPSRCEHGLLQAQINDAGELNTVRVACGSSRRVLPMRSTPHSTLSGARLRPLGGLTFLLLSVGLVACGEDADDPATDAASDTIAFDAASSDDAGETDGAAILPDSGHGGPHDASLTTDAFGDDAATGPGERSAMAEDQQVTLRLMGNASNVQTSDFLLLHTHAKLDRERAPVVDGERITFFLDDGLLPDDEPVLDYFGPDGSLVVQDARSGSFQVAVRNDTSAYSGTRELVRLSPGDSIQSALRNNALIVLPRGARFEGSLTVSDDDVVLTAGGTGERPVIRANEGIPAIRVDASGLRIANLRIEGNNTSCIRGGSRANFLFVTGNEIDNRNPRRDATALVLFARGSSMPNVFPEGSWALDNDIDGYEDGISSKLEPGSLDPNDRLFIPAEDRRLGGGHTPFRIELNRIHGIAIDGPEGDAIQVGRGGYYGTRIRRNTISGWGDDGIDMFGARDLVVEHNFLDNQNMRINNSGNGIKMGGDDGTHRSSSGRNIVRFNVILRTVVTRFSGRGNGDGMTSNGGGRAGVSEVYGNLVAYAAGHGMQFTSSGEEWRIYNNTFFTTASDSRGVSQYRAANLDRLYFEGNVASSFHGELPSAGNLRVERLDAIYEDLDNLLTSALRADSPTRGVATDSPYSRDRFGHERSRAEPVVGELLR